MIDPITIGYVVNAPYFWWSMGMTCAIATFIGAIIYDGELSNAWKGLISVLVYAFFIFQVDYSRLLWYFQSHPADLTRYAGVLSILLTTLFWLLGVTLGVLTSRFVIHRKRV